MLRLSVNVLTSIFTLLKRIDLYPFSSVDELILSRGFQINIDDLFKMACDCRWAEVRHDGKLAITERGKKLIVSPGLMASKPQLRLMIEDYIINIAPIWRNRIPYGRMEAVIFMSKDEKACLFEAGLLDTPIDEASVLWWDRLSDVIRISYSNNKMAVGRSGELCTLEYERKRTQIEPKWVSIDSNLSGYDIISQENEHDNNPILIEVKASTEEMGQAFFHISANEWLVATASKNYFFYIWSLRGSDRKVAIVSPAELSSFIPQNNMTGEWESVKIPFLSIGCFKKVTL